MNRLVIAMVRHGHYVQAPGVPSAHLPHPLTETGRRQAEACAEALLTFAVEQGLAIHPTLMASSLLRAWETARIIAANLGTGTGRTNQVVTHDDLAERSVGAAANLTVEAIEQVLRLDPRFEVPPPGWKSRTGHKLPFIGAESLMEAGIRTARRLESGAREAASAGTDTLLIAVGHGGALRHAALHLGAIDAATVESVSMWHCQPVFLQREADTWRHVGGEWKVRSNA